MFRSAYEVGYDDGYIGRKRRTGGALKKLLTRAEPPGSSSPVDRFDDEEYSRGYGDGMTDAGKDWTA